MRMQTSEVNLFFEHSTNSSTMASFENSPVKSSPSFPEDVTGSSDVMDHDDNIRNLSSPRTSPLVNLGQSDDGSDLTISSSPIKKETDVRSANEPTEAAHTFGSFTPSPTKNDRLKYIQENCLDDSASGHQDFSDLENKLFKDDFDCLQSPSTATDKKIHWTNKQVHLLLDMVEQRLPLFKSRGVHANVWTQIGKEISDQFPQITTKHCYNKWKNLRRDVRLSIVNPNKSLRNADVLKRMSRLVAEMYPGDLDGISQVASPNSSSTPFKNVTCSPSPNVKKERKVLRHPKLTSKHLARQYNKETSDSYNQGNNFAEVNDQPITTSDTKINSNASKFESLLSAAAQSLMQDLQQHQQFHQNQSYQLDETKITCQQEPQQTSQNITNSLINDGLTSLLISPALLLNSQLLNGLINQSLNQAQSTDPHPHHNNNNNDPSETGHSKTNGHFTESQDAHDLRIKSNPHFSPSYNIATSLSNNDAMTTLSNSSRWTQDQIYELLDLLKTFHTEETRHVTLVDQMVEMALNLKTAAYRRLAALDELLSAFSNNQ